MCVVSGATFEKSTAQNMSTQVWGFAKVGAFKEFIQKEDKARYDFFMNHQEYYITEGLLGKAASDKLQKQMKNLEKSRNHFRKRLEAVVQARKEQEVKKEPTIMVPTSHPWKCRFTMRPPSPSIRKMLYDGKSLDGLGR